MMKKIMLLLGFLLGIAYGIQAQLRIEAVRVKSPLDAQYANGILGVEVQIADKQQKRSSGMLFYRLIDPFGRLVASSSLKVSSQHPLVKFQPRIVDKPFIWSAERPVLYTLEVELQKKNGWRLDKERLQVGFASAEVSENSIRYNGRDLRIKGVNYMPGSLTGSKRQILSRLREDLKFLKSHHVNAIRVRQLSIPALLYEVCDEYGFYLLQDEVASLQVHHPSVIPCPPTHPAIQMYCLWDYPNQDLDVKMEEMKKLYQDIRFFDFDREAGSVRVQNLHHSTSLAAYEFYYLVRDHGQEVLRAPLKVGEVAPGETVVCTGLEGITADRTTTGDVRIEFYATQRKANRFFEKGCVMAREQTYIHTFYRPEKQFREDQRLLTDVIESEGKVVLNGQDLQIVFERSSGQLISYRYLGEEYIHQQQGPRPFFWRAPTVSDAAAGLPQQWHVWKTVSYQPLYAKSFTCVRGKEVVTELTAVYEFPAVGAVWRILYKVYPDGAIKVDNHFEAAEGVTAMIPRVGLRWQLNPQMNQVTYFGRGPRTNYRDCRTAQFLGTYTSRIDEMMEPSPYPQENGHRTDIYWCALQGRMKGGLLLVADRTFEMNLSTLPLENLERSSTAKKGQQVDFFVDYRMMGVGADNRYRTPVQEPYLIRPGKDRAIDYGFVILPFQKQDDYRSLIRKY